MIDDFHRSTFTLVFVSTYRSVVPGADGEAVDTFWCFQLDAVE